MYKKLGSLISLFALSLVWVSGVSANEGRIVLKNDTVACEGISVWRDGRYRITGRCSGLVYPYQEKIDSYTLWAREEDSVNPVQIDGIEVGFFSGQTDKSLTGFFVTAEEDSSPRLPSDIVIALANIIPFDFNVSLELQQGQPTQISQPTPTPVVTAATTVSVGLRRWLTTVAIIGGVLVAVIVAFVVLSRRG